MSDCITPRNQSTKIANPPSVKKVHFDAKQNGRHEELDLFPVSCRLFPSTPNAPMKGERPLTEEQELSLVSRCLF